MDCFSTLINTIFESNYAEIKGGAIFYNRNMPLMQNLTFLNNTALIYGPDIASYPVSFKLNGSSDQSLVNVASG